MTQGECDKTVLKIDEAIHHAYAIIETCKEHGMSPGDVALVLLAAQTLMTMGMKPRNREECFAETGEAMRAMAHLLDGAVVKHEEVH